MVVPTRIQDIFPEALIIYYEKTVNALMTFVEQLGETCKSILVSFYYFGHRLEQVAGRYGYQTVRPATVLKYKC